MSSIFDILLMVYSTKPPPPWAFLSLTLKKYIYNITSINFTRYLHFITVNTLRIKKFFKNLGNYFQSCHPIKSKLLSKLERLSLALAKNAYFKPFVVSLLTITNWETSCQNAFPYPAFFDKDKNIVKIFLKNILY